MAKRAAKGMRLNVRIDGALGGFVAANVGGCGAYNNVSEYVRDLIRRDKARAEGEAFDLLMAELARGFAALDSTYHRLDADTVIRRNSTGRAGTAARGLGSADRR